MPYPKRAYEAADRTSRSQWMARKREARRKQNTEPPLKTISTGTVTGKPSLCWCGELDGHDWPGKDQREPHPR